MIDSWSKRNKECFSITSIKQGMMYDPKGATALSNPKAAINKEEVIQSSTKGFVSIGFNTLTDLIMAAGGAVGRGSSMC